MKKLFVAVAALGMLLTSCAKDDVQSSGGNGVVVSFEIAQPTIASRALATDDATKVFGTGVAAEDLQYAIYEAEKDPVTGIFTIRDNGQEPISGVEDGFFAQDKLINTLENIRLVRGKYYIALFWAQSDAVNGPWNVDWATQEISLKDKESLVAQDENLDAFFTRVDFQVDAVASSQTFNAELKRPFAQVNVLTADAKEAQLAGLDVYESSIEVSGVYTSMNLMTGAVDGENTLTYNMAEKGSYMMSVDNTDYDLLSMNYLLVNTRKTVDIIFRYNEDAAVQGNDNTVFKAEFDMVPVERNYRTNIIGDILTSAVSFKIVINPIFTDDIIHDITKTPEDLLVEAAAKGGSYTLASDVELSKTLQVAKDFTLDLNGFNITVNNDSAELGKGDGIIVTNGHLTINGEGTVTANTRAVWARGNGGAKVTINGGKYVGANSFDTEVIYASGNGVIDIYGGEFEAITEDQTSYAKPQYAVLNIHGNGKDGCDINVYGGKFKNFDPANNVSENPKAGYHNGNFVAEGLFSSKVGDYYVVSDAIYAETAEVLAAALTSDAKEIKVILVNDIDVPITSLGQQTPGSGEYKLGGVNTEKISIDLGGNTLNITTTYWSAIGAKNADALFTIKNGYMTSTGNSAGTWNAWDLRFSNCNYAFEGVDFLKAVALDNVGKSTLMKKVTITDTHNKDTYGLWITAEGQTVTLEDCVIDMTPASDGRGIKIDEQYVDAPAKVTLNVTNTTFVTEEKSAILVKSAAGAEINWGAGNDITGVAADTEFAVWVDSDAAAHASKVVVNGAWVKIEGENATYVTPATLASALDTYDVVYLAAGDYGTIVAKAGKTYAAVNAEAKVDAVALNGAANVTLRNITFDAATAKGAYDGKGNKKQNAHIFSGDAGKNGSGSENLVVDGCTFAGTFANGGVAIAFTDQNRKSGQSGNITIKNCTFATEGGYYDIYCHYSGKGHMNIENNTFKSNVLGLPIYLGRYQSSTPVVVKGNAFENVATFADAAYIQAHSSSYTVSFNESGNTFAN